LPSSRRYRAQRSTAGPSEPSGRISLTANVGSTSRRRRRSRSTSRAASPSTALEGNTASVGGSSTKVNASQLQTGDDGPPTLAAAMASEGHANPASGSQPDHSLHSFEFLCNLPPVYKHWGRILPRSSPVAPNALPSPSSPTLASQHCSTSWRSRRLA